jgi:transketolase
MIKELKADIVKSAFESQEGHIPSAFSILDILWVLYDKVLNINPTMVDDPNRDRFILSKGHGSLGLYAVLAKKGFIDPKEMSTFGKVDSRLGGHPDRNKIPGVEASTGSLGHGMPIAVGTALGLKIQNNPARVFALVGDGEANEGTVWESALLAAHHGLDNLYCILDYNHSTDRALSIGDMASKFESFGWRTATVDGHDQKQLEEALREPTEKTGKPLMVVANTIKGYGLKSMENNPAWHHRAPTAEERDAFTTELA